MPKPPPVSRRRRSHDFPMDLDNPDNRPVLVLGSDENYQKLLHEGVYNSNDFNSKGELDIKGKTLYGRQEPPVFPRATKSFDEARVSASA